MALNVLKQDYLLKAKPYDNDSFSLYETILHFLYANAQHILNKGELIKLGLIDQLVQHRMKLEYTIESDG